jgi:hypothetical protein
MVAFFGRGKNYRAFLNGRLLRRRIDFRHILQPLADAQVAGAHGGANSGVPQLFENMQNAEVAEPPKRPCPSTGFHLCAAK